MKVVYSDVHKDHDPQLFMVRGLMKRSNEQPERAYRLLDSVRKAGYDIVAARDFGAAPRAAVHSPEYLHFLETAYARWQLLEDASSEVMPNAHPIYGQPSSYPASVVAQAGYHIGDMAASIGAFTWHAAVASANVACEAAQLVLDGAAAAYALCRPPGHHAYGDVVQIAKATGSVAIGVMTRWAAQRIGRSRSIEHQLGRFAGDVGRCYLNNVAIVAQLMRQVHQRIAILDIDVHHGNGTQGIFYRRQDVLTISLHCDPSSFYPFFTGYANERGDGDGVGYNYNMPLASSTDVDAYLPHLDHAIALVRSFAPGALIVALGLDTHESDPYRGMKISTGGFARILNRIASLGLPSVLVQEGGYLSEHLGPNLVSALDGFEHG